MNDTRDSGRHRRLTARYRSQRAELAGEIAQLPEPIRADVQAAIGALLEDPYFDYVIVDVVDSYGQAAGARQALVRERAQQLAAVADND